MVQLSDEAYMRLRRVKRSEESFSDVVNRLTRANKPEVPLQALKPTRTDEEWDAYLKWLKDAKALELQKQRRRAR